MKQIKKSVLCIVALFTAAAILPLAVWGFEAIPETYKPPAPNSYLPTYEEALKYKKHYDDPRPYWSEYGPKEFLPPELYNKLTYDIEEMKNAWAEVVGFKSPDVVGKIAPEIKLGKYTYADKEKYPGLKELMWEDLYNRIKPGGPPHIGNIPEFEIVATRQYYHALPVAELTKMHEGKTKQDDKGYIIWQSWQGGYPFPKPSGPFKAQQIMYNWEKRYTAYGLDWYMMTFADGYTKELKRDLEALVNVTHFRLAGRALMPPYGWYDASAEELGAFSQYIMAFTSPRDIAGVAQGGIYFLDPNKVDQQIIYIPSLRRLRKMSATDTQDPVLGIDMIYDDKDGFYQKLSPEKYPYKFEVLDEREYLCPNYTWDGSDYISSKDLAFYNIKFERRPMYVIKMTQVDPNYVYGARLFYIDKETFVIHHSENYDQKGRLYRTFDCTAGFVPEMGSLCTWGGGLLLLRDHVDMHSTIEQGFQFPAFWRREDVSLRGIVSKGK